MGGGVQEEKKKISKDIAHLDETVHLERGSENELSFVPMQGQN